MQTRQLGPFTVSAIGLGAMPFSMNNDKRYPSESEAISTVHAALDAGITYVDTADIYAPTWDQMGHNETIVGKALRSYGGSLDGVVVGTKGGITRSEGEEWGRDGSEKYLRQAVEDSLRALQTDVIDLYQWHRPDRWQVYGDVIGHFQKLQQEGKIKAIGISNANVEEIEVAQEVLGEGGLASVQNEFSPKFRSSEDELEFCGEHGIAFLPWSPLGGTGGGGAGRRRTLRCLRRDRSRARRESPAGRAGLGAVARQPRHSHSRGPSAGDDHRLGPSGRSDLVRGRTGSLLRNPLSDL